jgi:hypothetical protein
VPTATNLQWSDAPEKEGDRTPDNYSDCPVRHPIEGKISLPRMPPTAPSCLGARDENGRKRSVNTKTITVFIFFIGNKIENGNSGNGNDIGI